VEEQEPIGRRPQYFISLVAGRKRTRKVDRSCRSRRKAAWAYLQWRAARRGAALLEWAGEALGTLGGRDDEERLERICGRHSCRRNFLRGAAESPGAACAPPPRGGGETVEEEAVRSATGSNRLL
jgi:hypothetical protein